MQKVKVKGHSVQKLEWKRTDGRTDGRYQHQLLEQEAFAKCEPPLHCQSPGVASRTPAIAIAQAACDVHNDDNDDDDDDDNDNDNA